MPAARPSTATAATAAITHRRRTVRPPERGHTDFAANDGELDQLYIRHPEVRKPGVRDAHVGCGVIAEADYPSLAAYASWNAQAPGDRTGASILTRLDDPRSVAYLACRSWSASSRTETKV